MTGRIDSATALDAVPQPYLDDGDVVLYHGDVIQTLRQLPAGIAQTCVTSPPYWGLRDYGTGEWSGGDEDCDHIRTVHEDQPAERPRGWDGAFRNTGVPKPVGYGSVCGRCGARRVDSQLGLEATPTLYVERMVAVFREVWRVLRDDGTVWLNLGDSYVSTSGLGQGRNRDGGDGFAPTRSEYGQLSGMKLPSAYKPKDLVGIPWRVAFALQTDGWVLRSAITWSKPNPMPESVSDRPTKSSEDVFLFAKGKWSGPERGRFADISDEDARWLALLFDTEGNIVIKRAERDGRLQFGAQMAFANCSRPLLERAQAIVGMGSLHTRPGKNAPVHYWQMTGQQARDLLHRIYPFLIVKQRQARVAIYMQDVVAEPKRRPGGYRSTEHEAFLTRCWQTVSALNQFGDPDLSWVPEPQYGGWRSCERYYMDMDAIREDAIHEGRIVKASGAAAKNGQKGEFGRTSEGFTSHDTLVAGRNRRSVWTIPTEPFPQAHFATYPQALVRPCILAGTSEHGECVECGAPGVRQVEREGGRRSDEYRDLPHNPKEYGEGHLRNDFAVRTNGLARPGWRKDTPPETRSESWRASCTCDAATRPQTVLDPFIGSGTTALVARNHARRCIGIDLSAEYLAIAARRLQQLSLLGGTT